jgi:oxygen-independent coproporphyrinogen-3 oxidase
MREILALAERSVPRYTSYPTAPHFSAAVGPETYAAWLDALAPDARLSLYLHVPYCTHICLYCGCNTKAALKRNPIDRYACRLLDEIWLTEQHLGKRRVTHLHWGGGTPSILGEAWLAGVTERLAEAFDLSTLDEHAIELDPRRVSKELVRGLARLGVNRVSLGVQDFAPHVQQAIGRIQPFEQVARTVEWLRDAGIARVNIDLMYGLPHQTVEDVARSARLAASLAPQRLALFGYAHVPWLKTHQRLIDEASLPGAAARLEQARVAGEVLLAEGFFTVGLDHFATPGDALATAARTGTLHRNFQGYTTDESDALIGIGASAIGRLPQGFVQNAPDVATYSRAVEAGRFATAKGIALTEDDRLRGAIIERLMCDMAVDVDRIAPGHWFMAEFEQLGDLVASGVVRVAGSRIEVTEAGRPFLRLVAAAFDAYLPRNRARHSIAV